MPLKLMAYNATLIHNENDNELIPFVPDIEQLSKWVSGSWWKSKNVMTDKIPNNFLIVPMYLTKEGEHDGWQSQISGKTKKNETIYEAVQREIFEEIGLAYNIETIMKCYIDKEDYKGCKVHYFNINLNDSIEPDFTLFEDIALNCKERAHLEDDKSNRISVFIHFNEIDEFSINKIKNRRRIECDDVAGKLVMIIQKQVLDNMMNNLDFKKKNRYKKK